MATQYYGDEPGGYDTVKVDNAGGYNIQPTDGDLNAWQDLWTKLNKLSTQQLDIFTLANPEIGDIYTLTVTGMSGATASVSFTATSTTPSAVAAGRPPSWGEHTNDIGWGVGAG